MSDTAEYGGMSVSNKLVNDDFKSEVKSALNFIQSGDFHREWKKESEDNYPNLSKLRSEQSSSPINEITKKMLDILSKNNDN